MASGIQPALDCSGSVDFVSHKLGIIGLRHGFCIAPRKETLLYLCALTGDRCVLRLGHDTVNNTLNVDTPLLV